MRKLSTLRPNETFKLATSDNVCIFLEKRNNGFKDVYVYKCVNSDNIISTFNDYNVF